MICCADCQTFYQCYTGGAVCYPCPQVELCWWCDKTSVAVLVKDCRGLSWVHLVQGTLFNAAGYCDAPSDVTCPNAGVAGKSATHIAATNTSGMGCSGACACAAVHARLTCPAGAGLTLPSNLTAFTLQPPAPAPAAYTCPDKLGELQLLLGRRAHAEHSRISS